MTQGVNRIAFVNSHGEIETIAPDGSGRRQLTAGGLFFQFPAWSPNNCYIAAVGVSSRRAGIFLLKDDPDRCPPLPIYESNKNIPVYAYWSPDGRHISFITNRFAENSLGLHVVSLDDLLADELISNLDHGLIAVGRPCFWDWSADGKRILLHIGPSDEEGAQLEFIDPFNPHSRRRSIARPGLFQAPGIARSGQFWAFGQVDRAGKLQLVVDGYDASNRLVIPYQGLAAMSWSPTHDQLAYISPTKPLQTYYGPLRLLDVATAKVRVLADDVVIAFFWSPDGRRIAYFTIANVAEYLRERVFPNADVAARAGGFLGGNESTEDADGDDEPIPYLNLWSVDVESGDTRLITTFEPARPFANLLLPFFDQYALSHRIWSPNSDAVVLTIVENDDKARNTAGIYIVPIDQHAGQPRRIAEGTMAAWSQC